MYEEMLDPKELVDKIVALPNSNKKRGGEMNTNNTALLQDNKNAPNSSFDGSMIWGDKRKSIAVPKSSLKLSSGINTYISRKYEDDMEKLEKRMSDQLEKEKADREYKTNKRKWLINAIGDGVSALSNLVATTQGAYDASPKETLSGKSKSRYDKIMDERLATAAARRKEQMDLLLANLGYKHQVAENEKNRQSRREEYLDKVEETKRHNEAMEAIQRDKAASYKIMAQASMTRADKNKSGGGSSPRWWTLVGDDGRDEYFDTKDEWIVRAKEYARALKIPLTTQTGRESVSRDITDIVADVNKANRKKKKIDLIYE